MIELCSDDLQGGDKFDWWCTQMDALIPTRMTTDTNDFHASATLLELGRVDVSVLEFSAYDAVRTHKLIQRSDPEWWGLSLISAGSMRLEQHRNAVGIGAGDLVLYDTSHFFKADVQRHEFRSRVVTMHLPRNLLPLPDQALQQRAARSLPSTTGAGALLARFLQTLVEQATMLQSDAVDRLGSAAADLAIAFLAHLIDAEAQVPHQTRQRALLHEIKSFIMRNLDQPDLSTASIAAAHHISVRYLHYLFQHENTEGQTVAEFVRHGRLERCRIDLMDPHMANRSVAEIGARWGFPNATIFGRAFKRIYGITPGEHRKRNTTMPVSVNRVHERPLT